MKTRNLLVLLAPILFQAQPALAADKTARSLLSQIMAEAKTWQADGILVNINTQSASSKGTAPMWAYSFHSPKTKKKMLIMADGQDKPTFGDSMYFQTAPVGVFSIDSDQAMATAIKNGLKPNNFGMGMNLESNNGKPEWRLLDKTYFYYVDAANGKFLRKEKTD